MTSISFRGSYLVPGSFSINSTNVASAHTNLLTDAKQVREKLLEAEGPIAEVFTYQEEQGGDTFRHFGVVTQEDALPVRHVHQAIDISRTAHERAEWDNPIPDLFTAISAARDHLQAEANKDNDAVTGYLQYALDILEDDPEDPGAMLPTLNAARLELGRLAFLKSVPLATAGH